MSKLSKMSLRDISRLLEMYKDCLKICFYHLEEFGLFEYLKIGVSENFRA